MKRTLILAATLALGLFVLPALNLRSFVSRAQVIQVQTEGNGDIFQTSPAPAHNHFGAMVWDGAQWIVNPTWTHRFFVDVHTGLRLKPFVYTDVNQSGTYFNYQVTRNSYTYAIASKHCGSIVYQAVEYVISNTSTGKKVIIRSRGSGNGKGYPFFNIYIEDETASGNTQTTAFRGDPVWFTYALPAGQAVDQTSDTTGKQGDLPSVSAPDDSMHTAGYYLDIGGGGDLGPAGVGKSYHFHTRLIPSQVADLGSSFPIDFDIRFMDSIGDVHDVRFFPEIISETYGTSSFQFSAANYDVTEGCTGVQLTVTRAGDTSGPATVDYATDDGTAQQRTDYTMAQGTVSFAAGETSKTFTLLANEDHYVEGPETFHVTLNNPTGCAAVGTQNSTTVTIMDGDSAPPTANPNDDAALFVCQHYHDFMSRTPDPGGATYWTQQITQCGSDPTCIRNKRIDVSNAFFYEQEFQDTGAYVYRIYKLALGERPTYDQFMPDRSRVIGGPQLEQSKTAFAEMFVQRPAFIAQYPTTLAPYDYVEALNAHTGGLMTQAECTAWANGIQGGTETRGTVLRKMADHQLFIDAEYNTSFVLTQYFGYLRRSPDQGGFDFWLGQVNQHPIRDVGIQHAMVCSFITSREYQERFSSVVLHSNAECPQ